VKVSLANGFPLDIRPGHAGLIAETLNGMLKYRSKEEESEIDLFAGILDISNNLVTILTPGRISNTTPHSPGLSEKEYDRLMKTLIENFNIDQDLDE
jgi:F0F1-type ATP synthase epsilon subunit